MMISLGEEVRSLAAEVCPQETSSIERILPNGQSTTFDDTPIIWKLPKSNKTPTQPWCGSGYRVIACPEHLEDARSIIERCYNPLCPVCGDAWASRDGKAFTERMVAAKKLYTMAHVRLGEVKHYMFSPPQDWAADLMQTKDGYKKLRKTATRLIRKAGMQGGIIVFHHMRFTKSGRPVRIGPHFHVVGHGYLYASNKFHKDTGWIYKNKGPRETLSGTISYLLSHCGLGFYGDKRRFHAYTWFGKFAYNQVCKDRKLVHEKACTCEKCGEQMHLFENVMTDEAGCITWDNPRDMGIYLEKIYQQTYYLRNDPWTGILFKNKPPPLEVGGVVKGGYG